MSAASLYVGDLLPHITEVTIYKKFAPLGTVTSVKLCRDWVTGKSLCYAYVNFENPAEAEKAYRTLNYELLEGQPMRIVKSTRNPWLHKGGDSCCHHHCCGGGGSGGKGMVDAKTLVEAIESYSMAFKQTLGMQDSGEPKAPTGYKYSSDFLKRMNNANKQYTNVFIKNFKDLLDDYRLWKLCKQFGEIVSAKVMVDEYGISRGFGFACFTDSDAAQRAVKKLNGLVLDGRTLYAGPAMTGTQRQRDPSLRYDGEDHRQTEWRPTTVSSRICIRNLRDLVDDVRLYKEFQRFGPVQHSEVMKTPDGKSSGTGYVDFKDKIDAARALNSMNGKAFYGTRITVTYVPHTNTVSTNTSARDPQTEDDFGSYCTSTGEWDVDEKDCDKPRTGSYRHDIQTGNDLDNCNKSSNTTRSLLHLTSLANSLADKGHPININDIGNFTSTSVNRNSSNNSDINTSNNALRSSANRKPSTGLREGVDDAGREKTKSFSKDDRSVAKDDILATKDDNDDDDDSDTSATATLCVKNLDESISDDKLENLFTTFGTVISAKVISSEFGASKGFGFVIMSEAQDAVKAIKSLDGRIVVNRPIYVAPAAQPRPLHKT